MQGNLKIVYISGWGRSGSTLLDNMLGQLSEFASVGELRYVWDRGLRENRLCGCGAAFRDCAFWRDVFTKAFGGFQGVNTDELLKMRDKYDRTRQVLLGRGARSPSVEYYRSNLRKLYFGISAVSGANILVDSSKTPSHGRILQSCPELEMFVVHLVRDSRAVAYSWQRKRSNGEGDGGYMSRFSPLRSSLLWNGMNAATEMLRVTSPGRYLRIRYEDLVASPRGTLTAILELLGKAASELPFLHDHKAVLAPVHGFSGNPSRFQRGTVELRPDDEWRRSLKRTAWLLVTTLTSPFLLRYGYPLVSPEPTAQSA